jgi:hypothetical protein
MTSVVIPADRRSHRRYSLQIPLRYRAANSPLNAAWKHGGMLNMSVSSILIHVPELLPVGTKLDLFMDWTGLYHGRQSMRLWLVASVTSTGSRGTALRILSHRFRDVIPDRVRLRRDEKNLAVA